MAAADAMGPVVSSPPLERGRPVPAAGKALTYLWLAGQWVALAAVATAAVARRAWGATSPVVRASLMTSMGAFLFSMLILFGVGQETLFQHLKGVMPRKIVFLGIFVCAPVILLGTTGALVLEWFVDVSQGN
ncbi:hypothetical protein EJB05_49037, partial [Eragrostis curvula]